MHPAFFKKPVIHTTNKVLDEKIEINNKEIINYNIVKNILDYDFDNKTKFSNINNYILSLTSTIDRFISDDFILYIDNLYTQEIPAKYIFINIYDKATVVLNKALAIFNKFTSQTNKEQIENRIKLLESKYTNLFINMCDDLGPIIKILGLYNLNTKYNINDNDKIIIIDSESKISSKLIFYYELCYQLYNCEFIAGSNDTKYDSLFFDNLESIVSTKASYSLKYKYINKLHNFYNQMNEHKNNDDMIITLFYQKENLYSCGINIPLCSNITAEYLDSTKDSTKDNIKFEINNVNKRCLLSNIVNLYTKPAVDDLDIINISLSYFNNNIAIITLTFFQDIKNNIILNLRNKIININNLSLHTNSKKHTLFVKMDMQLEIQDVSNLNINIFQTYSTNLITRNKFYSISTILINIPYLDYLFFNDNDIIKFIEDSYTNQVISCYKRLNIGAFKADFFRVLYIYKNGGLYFDCKNVLYNNFYNYLYLNNFFVRDSKLESIYNGILYCKYKHSEIYFNYIITIMLNIIKMNYTKTAEGMTGSKLLFKLAKEPILFMKLSTKFDKLSEYIIDKTKILVNCSYYNYYFENNYLQKYSYNILWKMQNAFTNYYPYEKIDFVDHIVWINLDKSIKRQKHMVNLLSNIKIPSTRISAIDGTKGDLRKMMRDLGIDTIYTSNPEIGCTLSHIKAISYLSTLPGEYFLVLEDDITLDNLCLFDGTLQDIIKKCPKFDILQIHGITDIRVIDNTTTNNIIPCIKTIDEFILSKTHFRPYKTWSTAAYVISKQGIANFIKKKAYFNNNKMMIIDKKFDIADIYVYRNMVIYSYKYNFFSTQEYDSDIHTSHLDAHKQSLKYNLDRLLYDSFIIKLKNDKIINK